MSRTSGLISNSYSANFLPRASSSRGFDGGLLTRKDARSGLSLAALGTVKELSLKDIEARK